MDYVLQGKFQDFEHLAQHAKAWDLDFMQLEKGVPDYQLLMAGVGEVQVGYAQFNRKIFQRGAAPAGKRTIAIPLHPHMELQWYGQNVTGNDLMVFPNDGELISLSLPRFEVMVYSLSVEHLEKLCEALELPAFDDLLGNRNVLRLPEAMMGYLRKEAMQLLSPIQQNSQQWCSTREYKDLLEYDFASLVLRALAYSRQSSSVARPTLRKRSACVKTVVSMLESATHPPAISELCQIANVSERTLQYAFKDEFGMSPKQFIQSWRLNAVRKKLCSMEGSVSELASKHGYWHMGQFAADYRKMFGELPSDTLQRVSA